MKTEYLYGLLGLLGGVLLAILFTINVVNSSNTQMMRMMGMNPGNMAQNISKEQMNEMMVDNGMSMSGMVNTLQGKTGDEFDKAFIEQMIPHHQGAIDMAKLAQKYGFHQEIKEMADDIIFAQTSEINMLRQWQSSWGY